MPRPSRNPWFPIVALLLCTLFFEGLWRFVVRPEAAAVDARNRLAAARSAGEAFVPEQSIWVLLRDFEQEACFILCAWALLLIGAQLRQVAREEAALRERWFDLDAGERILPDDAPRHARLVDERAQALGRADALLPATLKASLLRFQATRSVQDASACVHEHAEAAFNRLDTGLSLVRYLAWTIPSVGFIGTVRGIGIALGQADLAIKGDISGVTAALGLAFNSTLIALVLSIVLMFFIHALQSRQEGLVQAVEDHCREHLLAVLKVPLAEHGPGES